MFLLILFISTCPIYLVINEKQVIITKKEHNTKARTTVHVCSGLFHADPGSCEAGCTSGPVSILKLITLPTTIRQDWLFRSRLFSWLALPAYSVYADNLLSAYSVYADNCLSAYKLYADF